MNELIISSGNFDTILGLPFADGGIRAGFPSPAQDYMDKSLDFNKELIIHPAATFYATVVGQSMINAGIDDGDIVVIDRALDPRQDDIVVVYLNGEYTMKYLDLTQKDYGVVWLRPGNDEYQPIRITRDDQCVIWGVVSKIIKNLR